MSTEPDEATPDWSEVPDRATSAARNYWLRMWDDNIAGSHAMMMHDDMSAVLRQAGAVPIRLRAMADATAAQQKLDEEAFRDHVEAIPLADIVLPYHQPLLARLQQMRPRTEQLIFEVLLCRTVDTFLSYLSDIIAEIFRAKPETLRSEETVTVQQVLAHPDLNEFIAWIADRRVNSLSYKGLRDIQAFVRDRFGLELVPDGTEFDRLDELVAVRNLIVHRRGVVDERFVASVGNQFGEVGDTIRASKFWASRHVDVPAEVVRHFDPAAAEKFRLNIEPVIVPKYWPEAPPHKPNPEE